MFTLAALLSAGLVLGGGGGGGNGGGPEPAVSLELIRRYEAEYGATALARVHRGIPAWARKYNVNCSACHTPAIPRLNADGERFKWAGYRKPEEWGEDAEVGKVQNYLAAGGRVNYQWEKTEGEPTSLSTIALDAITVFYAGPFGKTYNGFFELEHAEEGEIERIAQLGGMWGSASGFGGVRLGQIHYLVEWGLAGFDRPVGISAPMPLEDPLTATTPFALGEHQLAVEAFYVKGSNRLSAQVLNGVNTEGMGSVSDADTKKDFLVTDQLLMDNAGSGIQAMAYYGSIVGLDAADPSLSSHFWRLGLTANKIIRDFEVLGAVIYGEDTDLPLGAPNDKGLGYWVSGQYTFSRAAETPLTLFGRWEYSDPNTDTSDDANRRLVVGTVLPINVPQYLRWALEFRHDDPQGGLPKTNNLTTEFWLNF